MNEPEQRPKRPRGRWGSLGVAALAGASAVALILPSAVGHAEPLPPPPPAPATEAPPPPPADPNVPPPPPADPNAPPPPPVDPNAPPPPVDPNAPPPPVDPNAPPPPPAPEPGRIDNAAGGFSYVLPPGWVAGDASRLNYGQALLTKEVPGAPGQPAAAANDTSILLGRLDLKLFAGAEPDNAKAATRLASDMGEFFMPFAGTRINQETVPLDANGMPGSASYYEVKFTDTDKPDGQIWAGVVGTQAVNAPRGQRNERWFVVWLGTNNDPIDKGAAVALANSIRPWSPPPPPPPPPPPDPNAPPPPPDPNAPPPDPNAPPPVPRNQVGVPVPVTTPVPEMMPPPA